MSKKHQPSPQAKIVAERAKGLRDRMCWSRELAAEKAGISVDTYEDMEATRHEPSLNTLVSVANAYGVTVGYLLGEATSLGPSANVIAAYRALGKELGL